MRSHAFRESTGLAQPGAHRRCAALLVWVMTLALPPATAASPPLLALEATIDAKAALARAEAAFARGDFVTAEQEYRAVLAVEPRHPRALFRLAQIRRGDPAGAVRLLRLYVKVEPSDPWGHLALADALAAAGREHLDEALRACEAAVARAPRDREIALGRPRLLMRLGLIEAAIDAYETWLVVHREDGEAWRELADARRRAGRPESAAAALERAVALAPRDAALQRRLNAVRLQRAPAVELGLVGIGETDVTTAGLLLGADVPAGDGSRLGVAYQQRRIGSFGEQAYSRRLALKGTFRPQADLRIDLSGGPIWLRPPDVEASRTRMELGVRVRRSGASDGTILDVRAQHGPVDASPELVSLGLARTQVASSVELPLGGPWRLRGLGRLGVLGSPESRTLRTGVGGGAAIAVAPGVNVSGLWDQTRHHSPASGFFAPRVADRVEAGVDLERDYDSISVALDAGGGLQRFERHGEPMGPWTSAMRAWAYVAYNLGPGRQLLFEAEGYHSQVADAVIALDAERWRYGSITVSLRLSLR